MKILRNIKITKNYALKAALYRRIAKEYNSTYIFTHKDLIEIFDYESLGIKSRSFDEMKLYNGFAAGK